MTLPVTTRVGWCPGALKPMRTGDGLVLRLKPSGGVLSPGQAEAIADLADQHGNGRLDLTARANLQVRGVRDETLPALTDALRTLDLLDADADTEAIRNIVASPLAGLDASAVLDIRPVLAALEHSLAVDHALKALPAKWSVVVDDGGALPLGDVAADLRFEAWSRHGLVLRLGGAPEAALCPAERVSDVLGAIGRMALACPTDQRRVTDLLRQSTPDELFRQAGLTSLARPPPTRPGTVPRETVGPLPSGPDGGAPVFGLAAPFGSLSARALRDLARMARPFDAADLRLTPWRGVLVTGLDRAAVRSLAEAAPGFGLIADPRDPRLAVAACSGAPGCGRATTPVRPDAETLAAIRDAGQGGIALHVSGCAKGCAHPHAAPWTLVGRDGVYDLVRHGKAADAPVAAGLSLQEASRWLSREPREESL